MVREFQIMPATAELLPELLELERTCFSPPWTSKMWEAELIGNPFAHVLVAVTAGPLRQGSGCLIGFHCFWIVFEELRLMKLAVRESMRRRGVGRALVAEAIGRGMTGGSLRAVLEVRSSNEAAQRLYRELGFVSIGIRRGYYSEPVEDAVVMEMDPLRTPAGLQRAMSGGAAENRFQPMFMNDNQEVPMQTDDFIVEQLRRSNPEFRELEASHHRLDLELSELQKRHVLTPAEEVEKKRIQKEKLAKKDKLAELIRVYRDQVQSAAH
ncbi:MAG: ribosomal protein S18-alanine N-acetyltransferase [Nitrospira sp.]|nr:ribosomal protein S18-alanine N-acetyltransferase [Nitrospira sp.]